MKTAIVLTAAGMGRRFRHASGEHKLLTALNGKAVLKHTLDQARASGMEVVVVSRPEDVAIHSLLGDAVRVLCASAGLGESIAAGVSACTDYDGVIVALGDMPWLTAASYRAVNRALSTYPLVRPWVDDRAGHPVGFSAAFFPALRQLTGDTGAQQLLQHHPVHYVPLRDRGCLEDVDYPDDLRRIRCSP
ncbi:nucleotidyltransferase family protein [Pantoea stewartii]|uniref:nucleotidyltransferase family protein n=1 Tax=Pantoea stewartii TaxID=66269 RepID=UPI00138FF05C|nr:nucleotidyltransferase family protein [Pantoea stewartii]MBC0855654.1 nucleotidyltransferase family protein [Pantoea stewartii]